ncbi:MAG: cupin domain-containing protein [Gammaproteobacteria bacterium]|nr:cupin domain-containing protein [Gammaproteobacteria bacterium]
MYRRVPPGGAEIEHYHEKNHQFFFILSGEATLELEGEKWYLDRIREYQA